MAWTNLPKDTNTREHEKFEIKNGEVAVRTTAVLSGSVEATPAGLTTGFKITTMNISTSVIAIPATAQVQRNSISVFNKSETQTLYIGPNVSMTTDSVTGVTSGWEVPPLGTLNLDARDTITIYGAVASGSIQVKILEIA